MFRRAGPKITNALIVLCLAAGTRSIEGQTLSFFTHVPEFSGFTAVASDASGVYAFWSGGIRKYDSRGNELWTRQFSLAASGIISAAAVPNGVYILGYRSTDVKLFLVKYSTGGNELWTRELEFFAPGGMGVDGGGVYVAGRDFPPNATYLRKYDPDGAVLWTNRWGDPTNLDNPHSVAVDATGVYLSGIAGRFGPTGGRTFSFVRKWDSRGSDLWTRELFPSAVQIPLAAAESTGFYLLAAEGAGSSLHKYDSGGNKVWSRQIATSSPNNATGTGTAGGLAVDATGVYVVGNTSFFGGALPGQCRSGSGQDSFVRKYDRDGTEVWTRQFGTSQATYGNGVTVDSSGVYIVGQEGAAQIRDDLEYFDAFAPVNPARGAFFAKFEKAAAVVPDPRPRIFPDCVVNAASYVGGGVAPGEIVTIFGSAIGPAGVVPLRVTDDRKLANTLADTRILFSGVPAPLIYVSERQSSAIVPYAVAGRRSVDVQVEYKGIRSDVMAVPVLASRPGIFSLDASGGGQGAILNQDGSINSQSNPALRGSIITLYATGGGETAPGVEDGQILTEILPRVTLPIWAFFDLYGLPQVPSKPAEVLYAGGVSGSVAGLLQINLRVPENAVYIGDRIPFMLIIGPHWTLHQVTIALR